MARVIADALQQQGILLQTPRAARDLGLDGHTSRRSTVTSQARLTKASRRAAVIQKLVKTDPRARALVNTGHRPQASWGLQGQGFAPTTLRKLRGQVSGMTGAKFPGGCTTTVLRPTFGESSDPFVYGRIQLLEEWVNMLDALSVEYRALELAWKKLAADLASRTRRWVKAKGMVGAVIATLLDLDWNPLSPDRWVDNDGEEYCLQTGDPDLLINYALRGAVEQQIWQRASKWHHGAGAEGGIDFTIMKRHIQNLRRHGRAGEAAILQMVAQGALWPGSRRFGSEMATSTGGGK